MLSKREEERNEKIIRGLLKLPPNRKCINCNSLGPQYVCTNFWTFVCMTCSGIHREFTHRVKSVSMAKFTTEEVEALQKGGNQRAREMFLKVWDAQHMRLPANSNAEKIRDFIKNVYVHKKYTGEWSSHKSPRDMQSLKNHEEDEKRASSYHSFSQSPPYEHQYEDRSYGKSHIITLTRRPGSDRELYGRTISGFVSSPGCQYANGSSGSRYSDYSVPSAGDSFRYDTQSPNFRDSVCGTPNLHQVRDISIENARSQMFNRYSEANVRRDLNGMPRPTRTASSGSFGSIDSSSESFISSNSGSGTGAVLEPELSTGNRLAAASTVLSLSQSSTFRHVKNQDIASVPSVQPAATPLAPAVDLFAEINHQTSSTSSPEKKTCTVTLSANEGWATFDVHQPSEPVSQTNKGVSVMVPPRDVALEASGKALTTVHNNSEWFSFESSTTSGPFSSASDQLHIGLHENERCLDKKCSQPCNAFDDSIENIPHTSSGSLPHNSQLHISMPISPACEDPYIRLKTSEDFFNDGFQRSAQDDKVPNLSLPATCVSRSAFSPSVLHPMEDAACSPKSTNPFDFPDDIYSGANSFLDMSSIQAAMPNPEVPSFLGGQPQQWLPHSTVAPGGLSFMVGQPHSSQLLNLPPPESLASHGGNPFA